MTTESAGTATSPDGHYWERRRRGTAVPILVGALGLAALAIGQQLPVRHHIESDLVARSQAALRAARLDEVSVGFTGRDGTLTGSVRSKAEADRATSIVRRLDGVRIVDVELTYPGADGSTTGPSASPSPTLDPGATTAPSLSPTVAPTAPPAVVGSLVATQLIDLPQVTFDKGSATLTPDGRSVVLQAAAILLAAPGTMVDLRGYTDDLGDWDVNLELSQARANTVRLTLIANGVPSQTLTSRGFSEDQPKVTNDSPVHRAANRRVEFIALP